MVLKYMVLSTCTCICIKIKIYSSETLVRNEVESTQKNQRLREPLCRSTTGSNIVQCVYTSDNKIIIIKLIK